MRRIAIVTGAASGIGAALAAELVLADYFVAIADIDKQAASLTSERLNAEYPGTAEFHRVDVRDATAMAELVDRVVVGHGQVDLMVNNAGIAVGGSVSELSVAHWDRAIDVNLRGVVHGVHAALPHMIRQDSGHIVNIASLAGLIPSPNMSPYTATKHAVVGMTLAMQLDMADTNIKFTVVCPGFVDTPILDKLNPADLPPVASNGAARPFAESFPGGLYDVSELAQDITAGIEKNETMLVAPTAAKAAWRSYRTSPSDFMKVTKSAAQGRLKASD
jgi:NAD(P)-dependent dehydrogenase (short-subunit alcohol dehydrogenase family)